MKKLDIKAKIMIAFCLGAVLFVTSAFAEVLTKTGYEQFKDAAKSTMFNMETFDSYTTNMKISITDNDRIVLQNENLLKQDNKEGKRESTSKVLGLGGVDTYSFNYSDNSQNIYYSQYDDTYYVNKFEKPLPQMNYDRSMNPMNQTMVGEMEKILDAGIAALNLQNSITADKGPDGKTILVSSLSEGQIPPFINAMFSFAFKQTYSQQARYAVRPMMNDDQGYGIQESPFPALDGDVFIKSFTARMVVNNEGIVEEAFVTAVLSGKEKNGTVHHIQFDLVAEFMNMNTTVITAPDLTGKKVVVQENQYTPVGTISQAFVGNYKSDMFKIEKDAFVKTGEKHLIIESIQNGLVTAVYYEELDGIRANEMSIEATIESPNHASYYSTNTKDSTRKFSGVYLNFNEMDGTIHFHADNTHGVFIRIFE